MATGSSGLASIEQGKPLDAPLSDPATPSATWKSLAHSDSTASIEAEDNIVTERVDSVALAHMRLDKLNKANDSLTTARKRFGGQNSQDGPPPGGFQDDAAAGNPSASMTRKGSPGLASGLKKISGVFKKGLHLGRDSGGSVGSQVAEQPSPQPSGASPRVRFSMDDSRADS